MNINSMGRLLLLFFVTLLSACTTVNVDQVRFEPSLDVQSGDRAVVLGRHHSAEFETEPTLVACVARRLRGAIEGLEVVSEQEFVDQFYPYFEARTAPLKPARLQQVLQIPHVAAAFKASPVRYFISGLW